MLVLFVFCSFTDLHGLQSVELNSQTFHVKSPLAETMKIKRRTLVAFLIGGVLGILYFSANMEYSPYSTLFTFFQLAVKNRKYTREEWVL